MSLAPNNQPATTRSTLRAWLELFRFPNLFTVPGDVMAGFILAAGGFHLETMSWLLAIGAALCIYLSGLLLNDVVDLERDRVNRPSRPLPSGRVAPIKAIAIAIKFGLLGLLFSVFINFTAFITALLLIAMVSVYSYGTKQHFILGPVTMGLCRGLSVLLGTAASGQFPNLPFLAALGITGYVAAITFLARQETTTQTFSKPERLLPMGFGLLTLALMIPTLIHQPFTPVATLVLFLSWAGAIRSGWNGSVKVLIPEQRPAAIGQLVRALVFYQAALCVTFGDGTMGLAILCCWPLATWLGRTFYSS